MLLAILTSICALVILAVTLRALLTFLAVLDQLSGQDIQSDLVDREDWRTWGTEEDWEDRQDG